MDHLLDAIFQRISVRGSLIEQDFADLHCFYPQELEYAATFLDTLSSIKVYRPARGCFGGVFYVILDYNQSYLVFPEEGYCSCGRSIRIQAGLSEKELHSRFHIARTFCRHIIAIQLAIALNLSIQEDTRREAYESTLFSILMEVPRTSS